MLPSDQGQILYNEEFIVESFKHSPDMIVLRIL